jgi:AcrR family transcriptional regulator
MPRPADPERRTGIVETARRRFTTRGYDGTTIGDLAAELGISKAAIAYYFPTKETFLDEFVTPLLDDLEQAVDAADDPREALSGYLSAILEHHDVAIWMDTDSAIQNDSRYGGRLADINRALTAILTGRSRRKADRIRALAVLGGVWRPARELPTDDLIAHHDEIVDTALTAA